MAEPQGYPLDGLAGLQQMQCIAVVWRMARGEMRRFRRVADHYADPKQFIWTADAKDVPAKVTRVKKSPAAGLR